MMFDKTKDKHIYNKDFNIITYNINDRAQYFECDYDDIFIRYTIYNYGLTRSTITYINNRKVKKFSCDLKYDFLSLVDNLIELKTKYDDKDTDKNTIQLYIYSLNKFIKSLSIVFGL